jgi:hypothetical protein
MLRSTHTSNAARRSSRLAGGASGASANTANGRPAARSVRQRIADAERANRLRVERQRRIRIVIGRRVGSERVLIAVAIARGP